MNKKRFTIEESENQLIIFDNGLPDETYFHLGTDERDVKYVCDLLNQLANENEVLKDNIQTVKMKANALQASLNHWQNSYREILEKIPPKIKEVWIE